MRSLVILASLLFAAPVLASDALPASKFKGWTGPKPEKAPCECRARDGQKLGLGAKICVQRGERMVTMQCRLVLNNTAWAQVEEGCDVAMN